MTLTLFKIKNEKDLILQWYAGKYEVYANFESFCWHEWQNAGECDYE